MGSTHWFGVYCDKDLNLFSSSIIHQNHWANVIKPKPGALWCLCAVQADMRQSVGAFVARVHKKVNEVSQTYLTNERRYNYTTPKSFLEQIKLYEVR